MLRFLTAGESHGKCLTAILEGIPAGMKLKLEDINSELVRRQQGYGRGERMKIEQDKVQILSGVRWGETIGSPIMLQIENRDWQNWEKIMSLDAKDFEAKALQTKPRPGHGDLAGILKYGRQDIRDILERASARETASRVAVGAICKKLLSEFGVQIISFVKVIGGIKSKEINLEFDKIKSLTGKSVLHCLDKNAEKLMIKEIEKAKSRGDTLGGVFTVIADGVPVGLGNHIQWDLRLDGQLAQAIMSIPAVKGVEIGAGFKQAELLGSMVHDEIYYSSTKGFYRKTNRAGGLEAGITNGEDIVISAVMKPIPSLTRPLDSIDTKTLQPVKAAAVRSDVCAVSAAGVVAESMVAFVLAKAMREKFAGDSLNEMKTNYSAYIKTLHKR